MFCPNCGAKLSDGCKFCGQCGTQLRLPGNEKPEEGNSAINSAAASAADRERASAQQPAAAEDGSMRLQGIDLAAAICLWILTVICAFMLIMGIMSGSPRLIFTYLIRVVVFVMLSLICTYNMRGEQCKEEKDDIFLCMEAALVLSVIVFLIDLISDRSGWVEIAAFLIAVAVIVIYYFRLGNPETLITKPYAAAGLPSAVKNLLQIQKNIRAQLRVRRKAARQNAEAKVDRHLTNMVCMIVGICGAVLQMASMYLPMIAVNVSWGDTSIYSQGISFMALMADDGLTMIPMILLVLGVVEILFFVIRYKKLALIPGVVQIIGLVMMLMMYQDVINTYGGFYMGSAAIVTYPCGTIAVLVAPFIKIRKREA